MLGLLAVMILKRVSESIFFQSKKFKACKIKDEKEVANSDGMQFTEDYLSISYTNSSL